MAARRIEIKPEFIPTNEGNQSGRPLKGLPGVYLTTPSRTSEVALGNHLLECISLQYPVVSSINALWLYRPDEQIWQAFDNDQLLGLIDQYDGVKIAKGKKLSMNSLKAKGIREIILRHADYYKPTFFSDAPAGIQTQSGFVTVNSTGIKLLESGPEHRSRYRVDSKFSKRCDLSPWLEFLDRLFTPLDDKGSVIAQAQEFVGACLTGLAASYAKTLIMPGTGANGKSSFIGIIERLFPQYAKTSVPPQQWRNEYYLADLRDSLLNSCTELPGAELASSEVFKAVITGDPVTARYPYGRSFSYKPRGGHMFACNKLPPINDFSHGFWRRVLVVPFKAEFKSATMTTEEVVDDMSRHLGAILLWGLQGAHRLITQGRYTESQSSVDQLDTWREESDPVALWAQEQNFVAHTVGTSCIKLFVSYKEWSKARNFKAMNITTFGKRLTALGYPKIRKDSGWFYLIRKNLLKNPNNLAFLEKNGKAQ